MSGTQEASASNEFVKRDRRGIGDVEGRLPGAGRQPREEIAALAYETAHPAALRAEHECDAVPELQLRQGWRRGRVETADPEPFSLEPIEPAGEVDDAHERHQLERARGGFGERAGGGWYAVRGNEDSER